MSRQFLEVHQHYAKNIVVGFAKFNGIPCGIVANQPNFLAGVLDIDASKKGGTVCKVLRCLQHPDHHPG